MKVSWFKSELRFRYPFAISGGRIKSVQEALIIRLSDGVHCGFGEAPAITYYNVTVDGMMRELLEVLPKLELLVFDRPESFYGELLALIPDSFLRCAIDMAAWDLYGKRVSTPLRSLLGFSGKAPALCDYTIGLAPLPEMIARMQEFPWPIYKVKLGQTNDLEIMENLCRNSSAIFRVDVNGGWTVEEALEKIPVLTKLGVELIEQPLPPQLNEEMKKLREVASVPLIADESCVSEQDVELCAGLFDGINIKLTKCGGITPARRMLGKARDLGLKTMMGSMNECSIGASAVAAFLPQLDFADLDGPLLLENDLASGLIFKNGEVRISENPGLGIELIQKIFG